MKLSTQGRYAVRAMVDVALHAGESVVPRAEIARRQGISAAYIAHLFRKLERAGLVQGVKGPTGGYRLTRPPAQITVGDIVRAAEGPIALVHCVPPDGETRCHRAACCVTRRLWQQVSAAIADVLDGVTLQDLCEQAAREADDGQNLQRHHQNHWRDPSGPSEPPDRRTGGNGAGQTGVLQPPGQRQRPHRRQHD